MTPAVEIQEVRTTAEELDHVRELLRSYRDGLSPHLRFPDAEWRELPGAYSGPGGVLLRATVARQSAGCVGLSPFPREGVCEIKRLFVRPTFRGHKLGHALMVRILDVAQELGYRQVRLDTHLATMGGAVELYRRFRFCGGPAGSNAAHRRIVIHGADVGAKATAAAIEYCDFRLSPCGKPSGETMCPRCSTYKQANRDLL